MSVVSNEKSCNPYIQSFRFDGALFLFSPTLFLLLILIFLPSPWMSGNVSILGSQVNRPLFYLVTAWAMGHIVLVFYRALLQPSLLAKHKWKILLAPPLLLALLAFSRDAFLLAYVLGIFWQMYHYALQHFGLARIYSAKKKHFAKVERKIDLVFCLSVTFFPIVIGTQNFREAFTRFAYFQETNFSFALPFMQMIIRFIEVHKNIWSFLYFGIMGIVFLYYLYHWWRYRSIVWAKIGIFAQLFLVFSVGFIYFNPLIGILCMDLVHAVQYYGLLSITEQRSLSRWASIANRISPQVIAGGVLIVSGVTFGLFNVKFASTPLGIHGSFWELFPLAIISWANLIHYWFDAFLWEKGGVA